MARWFRLYAEVVNDPKVQKLPCEDFRAWINLLCLAADNDGKLPSFEDIAFALRVTNDGARTLVERLSSGGLIDRLNGGPNGWHYAPHAWAKRQYKSDVSTERVKRFRQRSETVSETPPETEADTEQRQIKKEVDAPPTASPKRGSRLPLDWRPSDDDLAFARTKLSTQDITDAVDNFRDHWHSAAGGKGLKLDWSATWRVWVRRTRPSQSALAGAKANGNGRQPASMAGILAERRRQAGSTNDVPDDGWILRQGDRL